MYTKEGLVGESDEWCVPLCVAVLCVADWVGGCVLPSRPGPQARLAIIQIR